MSGEREQWTHVSIIESACACWCFAHQEALDELRLADGRVAEEDNLERVLALLVEVAAWHGRLGSSLHGQVKANGSAASDVGKLTDADEFGNRIRQTRVGASVTGQRANAQEVGV